MDAQETGRGKNGRGNRAATTNKLLEAAAAEFMQRGLDSARISDIARNAGVTAGSIYARWATKTEMMVAALDHIFEQILPEPRIKDLGLYDLPFPEIVLLGAVGLLEPDSQREILTQVFGSARNNPDVHARLGKHLNDSIDQISVLVDRSKDEGRTDQELSTAAIALLIQAIEIGVHMMVAGGLDEDRVPSPSDWEALMSRFIESTAPPSAD